MAQQQNWPKRVTRPLPFLSTHHESRVAKSDAGGFQMSGQNARSV